MKSYQVKRSKEYLSYSLTRNNHVIPQYTLSDLHCCLKRKIVFIIAVICLSVRGIKFLEKNERNIRAQKSKFNMFFPTLLRSPVE